MSPEFEGGCFFIPNDAQIANLANVLFLDVQISNLAELQTTIAQLDEARANEVKDILKCAIGSFIVPSSSLIGISLGPYCDNIYENVEDVQTACNNTKMTIETQKAPAGETDAGLVYVHRFFLTDASDERRSMLEMNTQGEVKGEEEGTTFRTTHFLQKSDNFTASRDEATRIEAFNDSPGGLTPPSSGGYRRTLRVSCGHMPCMQEAAVSAM